jgi:hypothetical protein
MAFHECPPAWFEIGGMMRKRFTSCQRDDAGGLMKYRRSAQYCAARERRI